MNTAEPLIQNLEQVYTAIENACHNSRRSFQDVSLMAVTKYAADEDVLLLLGTGRIKHIGESRIQQAAKRWTSPAFAKHHVIKHFIGHLQKNKIAQAAALFDFIDSIDDIKTAELLNAQAEKLGKRLHVLVQIKLTQRESQSGVSVEQASALLEQLKPLPYLVPCGYMAIAPQTQDAVLLRRLFRQVKQTFDRDFPPAQGPRYLSLGMSEDFEIAVEEGSSLPRIGSKLFKKDLEEL